MYTLKSVNMEDAVSTDQSSSLGTCHVPQLFV